MERINNILRIRNDRDIIDYITTLIALIALIGLFLPFICNQSAKLELMYVRCDSTETIKYGIKNTGDFLVNLNKIKVSIPEGVFVKELIINTNGIISSNVREDNHQNFYAYELGNIIQGEEILYNLSFTYDKSSTTINKIIVKTNFYYSSQNSQSNILSDSTVLCY
jgi:hypothetical protein